MKLVKNDLYLLLLDEGAEIKIKSIVAEKLINGNYDLFEIHTKNDIDFNNQFVTLAYYPLTKEAKELEGLPKLPNPFEEVDVEKLAFNYTLPSGFNRTDAGVSIMEAFIAGYKAAQSKSKQFSLEDMIGFTKYYIINHAIPYELDVISGKITDEQKVKILQSDIDKDWNELAQKYIQSLSTQQLPSEFIPEYENKCWCLKPMSGGCFECTKMLKTITNLEGKQELVGIFKY